MTGTEDYTTALNNLQLHDSKPDTLVKNQKFPDPSHPTPCSVSVVDIVNNPTLLSIHLQPIVDLVRGISVGYEALSRFPCKPQITYPQWFKEANRLNLSENLEAIAISNARLKLPELPSTCFMSVNITPSALDSAPVKEALAGSLTQIAIELTGQISSESLEKLSNALGELRSRGAIIALDDTGVDYLGLRTLEVLKPEIVKLDRSLITEVDKDPIKQALIRMVSEVVEGIGGWVLAVGIERQEEIATLIDLKVPLGQGWVLGKPQDQLTEISSDLSQYISNTSHDVVNSATYISLRSITKKVFMAENLESLIEANVANAYAVVVDYLGQPVHLYRRSGVNSWHEIPITLLIHPDEEPYVVAKRILSREEGNRFEPVLCLGPTNQWNRILEVDDLFENLALKLEEIASKLKHLDH